jgi:predicted aspartyl protease
MKKLTIIAIFALLFPIQKLKSQENPDFRFLNNLYSKCEYFKFYNGFISNKDKFNEFEKLYLSALSTGKFNNPPESVRAIENLFSSYVDKLTDSMKLELYKAKYVSLSALYRYGEALEANREIINNFAGLLSSGELEDLKDNADFFETIKYAPPMKLEQKQESKIKIFKDLAGLINVPVIISGVEKNFVFDSGANFSVITESLAQKIGLKTEVKKFKLNTSTGIKIDASAAVSGDFRIGDCILKNVILLILPDEALTFGPFYKIEGIIGIPVMMALGELQIKNSDEMIISTEPTVSGNPNFSFSEYSPVMNVINENDSLVFLYDSGAQTTSLYSLYYKSHKKEIDSKYKPAKITFGGAGSMVTKDGYNLKNITLKSENYSITIPEISVLIEKIDDSEAMFYGKIGQNFFKNAIQITINYDKMILTAK